MSVGDAGVPHGEDEVDEEDDPGGDGHDAENEAEGVFAAISVALVDQAERADGDEEDGAEQVDEELLKKGARSNP